MVRRREEAGDADADGSESEGREMMEEPEWMGSAGLLSSLLRSRCPPPSRSDPVPVPTEDLRDTDAEVDECTRENPSDVLGDRCD